MKAPRGARPARGNPGGRSRFARLRALSHLPSVSSRQRFWDWFNADHPRPVAREGTRLAGDAQPAGRRRVAHAPAKCVRRGGHLVGGAAARGMAGGTRGADADAGDVARTVRRPPPGTGADRSEAELAAATRRELDACLLNDEEFARSPSRSGGGTSDRRHPHPLDRPAVHVELAGRAQLVPASLAQLAAANRGRVATDCVEN